MADFAAEQAAEAERVEAAGGREDAALKMPRLLASAGGMAPAIDFGIRYGITVKRSGSGASGGEGAGDGEDNKLSIRANFCGRTVDGKPQAIPDTVSNPYPTRPLAQ